MASAAIEACRSVTRSLLTRADREDASVRLLRQALGYYWSVAIAAAPGAGLHAFREVRENPDSDAQWIVRENLSKSRLKRLL